MKKGKKTGSHASLPDDAAFIRNPNKWPHLFLPLKKPGFICGLLFVDFEGGYRLYRANMWDLPKLPEEFTRYENAEAVVADGWRVD